MSTSELNAMAPPGAISLSGADVVAHARELIGTRWRHQGRSHEGVDCIGLPVVVRSRLGLETLDFTNYGRIATDESMLVYCRERMVSIARNAIRPGDILVMAFGNQRHMAIVGDYPGGHLSIIHAYAQAPRKVVEMRLDSHWMARVRGCFRFPEVVA